MCIPGCQCPNGTIWNGTFCVPPNECTCRDENGVIRTVTETFFSTLVQNCYPLFDLPLDASFKAVREDLILYGKETGK